MCKNEEQFYSLRNLQFRNFQCGRALKTKISKIQYKVHRQYSKTLFKSDGLGEGMSKHGTARFYFLALAPQ